MIHRLRRQKKLTNKAFRVLLTPVIEHLDLGYVYLTEGTLKLVAQRCPHLRVINLRDCGYVVTDQMMEMMLKVGGFTHTHIYIYTHSFFWLRWGLNPVRKVALWHHSQPAVYSMLDHYTMKANLKRCVPVAHLMLYCTCRFITGIGPMDE